MATIATLTSNETGANSLTDINNNFTAVNTIASVISSSIQTYSQNANSTEYDDNFYDFSTETDGGNIMTGSHTIKNLFIGFNYNGIDTGTIVFTMMKNGVAQTVTCTAQAGDTSTVSDTTHSFTVVAGDRITLRSVAGGTSGHMYYGMSYEIN